MRYFISFANKTFEMNGIEYKALVIIIILTLKVKIELIIPY